MDRAAPLSPSASARTCTVWRCGWLRAPRSRSLMPRALIPARSASSSCVTPAARRCCRSRSAKPGTSEWRSTVIGARPEVPPNRTQAPVSGWLDSRDKPWLTQSSTHSAVACPIVWLARVQPCWQCIGWLQASRIRREPSGVGGLGPSPATAETPSGTGTMKEETMDQFQTALTIMAADDRHWGPRDAQGQRRTYTVAELDALADFHWHWPDLKGAIAACANAVLWSWRLRPSNRVASPLPSAPSPSVSARASGGAN